MTKISEKEQKDYLNRWTEILHRFRLNFNRIVNLAEFPASFLLGHPEIRTPKGAVWFQDICRAAVVLSHASFEDALREIARVKLSESPAEILDDIPLVGISRAGQPRKFSLGMLNKHRGKTVDQLIRESIDEFLDRTSFNNSKDVSNMLEKIGVDLIGIRKYFKDLDEMMERRHQIVHRSDQEGVPEDGG